MNNLQSLEIPFHLRKEGVCLVMNPGNAGDALIALGTRHYLQSINAEDVPVVPSWQALDVGTKTIVFGGGGSLIPLYNSLASIRAWIDAGRQVIVLPHTTFGLETDLVGMSANLMIVCREEISYERLEKAGFPTERLGLDHDMAFHLKGEFLTRYPRSGIGIANCFRTDGERRIDAAPVPANNVDISMSWNGNFWHSADLTEAVCSGLTAYLSCFDTVHTDRLHIGILGASLGLNTVLYENSYYKNRAIFEYSIGARFPYAKLKTV
ncbi:polysaccharide pyruvyl transferase [Rhizobium freirei PRF 81]|uniref:Polysaccharide pyruvyl transferase n=1 Tax=Rhizobium freirei PRF 81 TaxID=363754 RepID=N6V3J6_9HYPH|nr:polysaccharide pyruvyl transferase family protein [Rhizobium freirei]ENN85617.1 polysaccharide pyruvyl transferase [Rhizobium freirei PRF 81]